MGIDTLTANRKCIPDAIRQAGYPSLATQTENDLEALSRAQTEQLGECQRQREDTVAALRAVLDAFEPHYATVYKRETFTSKEIARYPIVAALVQARAVLTEAG